MRIVFLFIILVLLFLPGDDDDTPQDKTSTSTPNSSDIIDSKEDAASSNTVKRAIQQPNPNQLTYARPSDSTVGWHIVGSTFISGEEKRSKVMELLSTKPYQDRERLDSHSQSTSKGWEKVLIGVFSVEQKTHDLLKKIEYKSMLLSPLVFNPSYYTSRYTDINEAYGNDEKELTFHWLTNGINEGRQGCESFDVQFYLKNYPDLNKKYGSDYEKYLIHWVTHGIKEGRQGVSK